MRLLASRIYICPKFTPVGIDRTPLTVDKEEHAVIELDLRACNALYIVVRNNRYEHPTANFFRNICMLCTWYIMTSKEKRFLNFKLFVFQAIANT
jgi:hypothetical protein